jgi:hypothetical protein
MSKHANSAKKLEEKDNDIYQQNTKKIVGDQVESIILIEKDQSSGQLVFNEQALELIKSIDGQVAVCLIAGPCRSGKSFLMNKLSRTKGFKVGHSDLPETLGIWINQKFQTNENNEQNGKMTVIYMDTEVKRLN